MAAEFGDATGLDVEATGTGRNLGEDAGPRV
jgi:hypothetical protein